MSFHAFYSLCKVQVESYKPLGMCIMYKFQFDPVKALERGPYNLDATIDFNDSYAKCHFSMPMPNHSRVFLKSD